MTASVERDTSPHLRPATPRIGAYRVKSLITNILVVTQIARPSASQIQNQKREPTAKKIALAKKASTMMLRLSLAIHVRNMTLNVLVGSWWLRESIECPSRNAGEIRHAKEDTSCGGKVWPILARWSSSCGRIVPEGCQVLTVRANTTTTQ